MSANLQKSLNFFRKYADNVFDNGKNMDMNLFSAMMSTNLLENEIKVCEIAEIKRLWTEHFKKEKKSTENSIELFFKIPKGLAIIPKGLFIKEN